MTVEQNGVAIVVNHPELCEGTWGGGMYVTFKNGNTGIMICQDNGKDAGFENQVDWTANDLDSLRHEAHHVVQDCLDGGKGDGELGPMFEGDKLKHVVTSTLSTEKIEWIINKYDKEDHLIELEAFAVAQAIGPEAIANAIEELCAPPSSSFRF